MLLMAEEYNCVIVIERHLFIVSVIVNDRRDIVLCD